MTSSSQFYTGLVAELYAWLRSADPDVERCARFVARHGTPELGCGDAIRCSNCGVVASMWPGCRLVGGHARPCRQRAAALNLDVVLHHAAIEDMDIGRRFRSIFLAEATFNLIVDDATAGRALERIAAHFDPSGGVDPVVRAVARAGV